MPEAIAPLKIVDAHDLDDAVRALLRPGEMIRDAEGRRHRLPRYFYEIPSYEEAKTIRLAPSFRLNEFIRVDLREAPSFQEFPRYVPCAIRILASYLQRIRDAAGAPLQISVNGGYRSPAHERNVPASPHMWGTAVDVYRVGSTLLHSEESIEKYRKLAEETAGDLYVAPYGHEPGSADDHLHVDLGYLISIPREISEDRMEVPQETPRFAFEDRRVMERRSDEG
ncbi:MAG TPA: D-Ala-D-Ala carboxypeptidase family metallohydrolase [Thermoanaerobaculia bacterium]|nr:D-Ala-D-Ala carboxypeptidase family metallohydrolase [Thermoanaerobaculia bacterium]